MCLYLIQFIVFLVGHGFTPFGFRVFAGALHGNMRKPAVLCRSMPMLYVCGNGNHVAGVQFDCGFILFLIPTSAVNAQQNLPAARRCVMNMPVIAALRLERNVCHKHRFLRIGKRFQVRIAHKIFCISRIRERDAWGHFLNKAIKKQTANQELP